jgi:hypothetical protein
MQPGQQPPQGFQWDSAGQQQTSSAPQMLQGAPNMLQGAPQQLMGNNAYGQQQMMMQQPSTNATAALVISLLSLVGGFLIGLPFLLAPISLLMANSALKTTSMHPGHSDHGIARAAQIISGIITGLMVVVFIIVAMFIGLLSANGF